MAWKRSVHPGWVAAMLVAVLALTSWAGIVAAQEGDAQARIVHAASGIGPVDVYVDGDLAVEVLDYGGATEYLSLPAGEYGLQVTAAGGDPAEAFVDAVLVLDGGTPHTVVAIGPADRADIVVLVDDHTPPSDGMSKVSLVNVTSDSIAVGLALDDGKALVEDVPFADASEYLELEAGMYDLAILDADSGGEVASIPGFTAEPGTIYSVFALGAEGEYEGVVFVDAVGSGSNPDATPTEAASTPAIVVGTPTTTGETPTPASMTPTAETTPTSTIAPTQEAATPVTMPELPDTGGGGASAGGGLGLLVWLIVGLLGLTSIAIWRFVYVRSQGRT